MKVDVYLNKRAMGRSLRRVYSLRDSSSGIVLYSNSDVLLKDVELVVQPSGRADTLNRMKEKSKVTKTVHAFLRGELVYRGRNAKSKAKCLGLAGASTQVKTVGYDPIKTDSWLLINGFRMPDVIEDCIPVNACDYAFLNSDGITII